MTEIKKNNKRLPVRFSLLTKMMILICSLIVCMLLFLGFYMNDKYSEKMREQIGIRALSVAQSVSEIPEIREAFTSEDPSAVIQPIAEAIRKETDSEFIVVGNREGIRYSHPLKERIGDVMVGDDNKRVFEQGKSYVSEAKGSLGPSIRGKTPIFSEEGDVIGVVSVGFLVDDVEMTIGSYVKDTWYWVVLCMVLGVIGATFISLHVKRSILGLEPEEIGRLFEEREAIFQSIHEAIIAVNKEGNVTMLNERTAHLLNKNTKEIVGKPIEEVVPYTRMPEVLATGERLYDQELWLNDERFIANRIPIYYNGQLQGAVSTFRNQAEIDRLAEELSKVKQYSEALRVQTHEFSNKLNTISGFLQLGRVDEATEFIHKESKKQQQWIHFLIHSVKDTYISAVLLGKLNRAHELGIQMNIDEDSELTTILTEREREGLVTILGNIVENAYDAALESPRKPRVNIFFTDIGHDILFEVEDSGPGMSNQEIDTLFLKGYTTKQGLHSGIGLSLVQQLTEELGGVVSVEPSDLGGACFVISIPKREGDVEQNV